MSVPKASVHDHRFLQLWEDQVWSSRQVSAMEAKTVPQTVGQATNNEFRLGVLVPHVNISMERSGSMGPSGGYLYLFVALCISRHTF